MPPREQVISDIGEVKRSDSYHFIHGTIHKLQHLDDPNCPTSLPSLSLELETKQNVTARSMSRNGRHLVLRREHSRRLCLRRDSHELCDHGKQRAEMLGQ